MLKEHKELLEKSINVRNQEAIKKCAKIDESKACQVFTEDGIKRLSYTESPPIPKYDFKKIIRRNAGMINLFLQLRP